MDSYEKGSEIAAHLLNVSVSESSIYRLTDQLGLQAEEWLKEEELRDKLAEDEAEVVYAQMDGSMILTREDSWREVKLGRVFAAGSLHEESQNRNWLKNSEYVAHLGSHKAFEKVFSSVLDEYASRGENLVFINDGAKWQWNWIEAEYPKATEILDFYHVMEHIGKYVCLLKTTDQREELMKELGDCLKTKGVQACLDKINLLECKTKTQRTEKQKLEKYIQNNKSRMDYPSYLKRNLLIGSGAIESAHRTVIQRRMKLSGQRWSVQGARNMINLSVVNMSGHWNRVQTFFKNAA